MDEKIKIPRWNGKTCGALRDLLSKQEDYEHWRKFAGFGVSLTKKQILGGIEVYGLQREYEAIFKMYNPPKPKRSHRTKPNGAEQPNNAAQPEPQVPKLDGSPAALARLENNLVQFGAAWALMIEMAIEVQAALRETNHKGK